MIVDENLSNVQTKAKHESTVYINSRYNISTVVQSKYESNNMNYLRQPPPSA